MNYDDNLEKLYLERYGESINSVLAEYTLRHVIHKIVYNEIRFLYPDTIRLEYSDCYKDVDEIKFHLNKSLHHLISLWGKEPIPSGNPNEYVVIGYNCYCVNDPSHIIKDVDATLINGKQPIQLYQIYYEITNNKKLVYKNMNLINTNNTVETLINNIPFELRKYIFYRMFEEDFDSQFDLADRLNLNLSITNKDN